MSYEGRPTNFNKSRSGGTGSLLHPDEHEETAAGEGGEEEEWVRTFGDPQLTRALEIPHIPSPGKERTSPKKARITFSSTSNKKSQSIVVNPTRVNDAESEAFRIIADRFAEVHARLDRLDDHVDTLLHLQTLHQDSREATSLSRTQLDSFCLEIFFESPDPTSVQENRILRELLKKYPTIDYRSARSAIRTWFRRRRDEYGAKLVHAFEAAYRDSAPTSEAFMEMRERILIGGLDKDLLERISQLVSWKLDGTPEALAFCTSKLLGHLSKLINNARRSCKE